MQKFGLEGVQWKYDSADNIEVIEPLAWGYRYSQNIYTPNYPRINKARNNGEFIVEIIDTVKDTFVGYDNEVMPVSVYEGFEDFNPFAAPMYREWGSKLVTGEIPMSDWDKYVKEWYDKGGQIVTDRATKWYKEFWGIN